VREQWARSSREYLVSVASSPFGADAHWMVSRLIYQQQHYLLDWYYLPAPHTYWTLVAYKLMPAHPQLQWRRQRPLLRHLYATVTYLLAESRLLV